MFALNIQHAHAAVAQHQRHGKFRANVFDGIDVARIGERIRYAHGMACRRRGAGDSLPHRNAQILRQLARIADRKAVLQVRAVAIEHQHAENFVVDVPLDQRRAARQHFVEIQRSVHLFADFCERGQHLGGHLECRRWGYGCVFVSGVHADVHYSRSAVAGRPDAIRYDFLTFAPSVSTPTSSRFR